MTLPAIVAALLQGFYEKLNLSLILQEILFTESVVYMHTITVHFPVVITEISIVMKIVLNCQ